MRACKFQPAPSVSKWKRDAFEIGLLWRCAILEVTIFFSSDKSTWRWSSLGPRSHPQMILFGDQYLLRHRMGHTNAYWSGVSGGDGRDLDNLNAYLIRTQLMTRWWMRPIDSTLSSIKNATWHLALNTDRDRAYLYSSKQSNHSSEIIDWISKSLLNQLPIGDDGWV